MNILILTGCDAAMARVGDLTSSNHRAYALRHGYDFERVTEYEPGSHPSWQKLRMVRERLPSYDAILWLDADTVVTNPMLRVVDVVGPWNCPRVQGLAVSKDWTHALPEDEIKHFSLGNFVFTQCSGSFKVLEAALKRKEWENRPLWEQQAIQEEYRENPEIRKHVQILPRRKLNAVPATPNTTGPEPWQPGDFLCHMTYLPNEQRVKLFPQFDTAGLRHLLPDLPAWHETGMCMDVRHIACLCEMVLGGSWKHALEIGVWQGASTIAFLAGIEARTVGHFTACDVGIQCEFRKVVDAVWDRSEVFTMAHMRSTEALDGPGEYDFVFVDGDHGLETVRAETELLLRRQPRLIAAHDIRASACGFGGCEGPAWLHAELERDGWRIVTDAQDRPGEMTKRGFLAATKDPEVHRMVKRAFALTCY